MKKLIIAISLLMFGCGSDDGSDKPQSKVIYHTDGSYDISGADGETLHFDKDGNLISVDDPNGIFN